MNRTALGTIPWLLLAACNGAEKASRREARELSKVSIAGAREFSERSLQELILPDMERYSRKPRPSVLDDACFRIAHHYRLHGYPDVRVEVTTQGKEIRFRVSEGGRFKIGRIHFRGHKTVSRDELRRLRPKGFLGSHPPFSPRLLSVLRDRVTALYRSRGYLDASIAPALLRFDAKEGRVNVTLLITEGRGYTLASCSGLPAIDALQRWASERVGRPYVPDAAVSLEATILDHYRDAGHPFVLADVRPMIDRRRAIVRLEATVTPGQRVTDSTSRIRGNRFTREAYIRGRADLPEGRDYSDSDLRRGEERLRKTGLFRSVSLSPGRLDKETGKLAIETRVEEADRFELSLRGGYGTLDGARGGADFRFRNIIGGGETFQIGGHVDLFGYRTSAEISSPFILGSDFRPALSAYYERQEYPSFEADSYGGVLSLGYQFTDALTATLGGRHAVVETIDVDENVPPGDLLDFDYTALFLSATWDRRDSRVLPRRGFSLGAQVEWSSRAFGSDIEFVNAGAKGTFYLPLLDDFILAVALQGGIIEPLGGTETIPVSLRYFGGGTNTVRGYEYGRVGPISDGNPAGGDVLLSLQVELRFRIWADLHGALFADAGGVWFTRHDVDFAEVRYSVGTGLRYYTPAGPIVADVAWNPSRREGEDSVEFHLSIGFPF